MNDPMLEICKHCGCTFGSHHGGSNPWPYNYCPGHEGEMDWDKGPGTVFGPTGVYKEDKEDKENKMEDNRKIEVLEMIATDMKNDATNFDGRLFNGVTVAEYFGNQGAAIASLANIVQLILEEKDLVGE